MSVSVNCSVYVSFNDDHQLSRSALRAYVENFLTSFDKLFLAELALFPINLVDFGLEFFLGETNAGDKR